MKTILLLKNSITEELQKTGNVVLESWIKDLKRIALSKGFLIVASSPLTRSSYHADEDFSEMKKLREKKSQCLQLQ